MRLQHKSTYIAIHMHITSYQRNLEYWYEYIIFDMVKIDPEVRKKWWEQNGNRNIIKLHARMT